MDVTTAIETYITKMVSEPSAIKVLLLDSHTVGHILPPSPIYLNLSQTPIISLASTQSTLLSHQVYLTDRIDNKNRDRMAHLKCVCFLRPSAESLEALADELKEPKYGEYYLCQWVNHAVSPDSIFEYQTYCHLYRLQQHIDKSCYRTSG